MTQRSLTSTVGTVDFLLTRVPDDVAKFSVSLSDSTTANLLRSSPESADQMRLFEKTIGLDGCSTINWYTDRLTADVKSEVKEEARRIMAQKLEEAGVPAAAGRFTFRS